VVAVADGAALSVHMTMVARVRAVAVADPTVVWEVQAPQVKVTLVVPHPHHAATVVVAAGRAVSVLSVTRVQAFSLLSLVKHATMLVVATVACLTVRTL
jgi:hypothetical protein